MVAFWSLKSQRNFTCASRWYNTLLGNTAAENRAVKVTFSQCAVQAKIMPTHHNGVRFVKSNYFGGYKMADLPIFFPIV